MAHKAMSVDKTLRQAKSFARKGDIDGARRLYEEILERFPNNARAREGVESLGKPQIKARGGFTTEKAKDALELLQSGRHEEALAHAEALLEHFPDTPFVHNLIGILRGRLGDSDSAITSYQKALELNPRYGEAHCNIGDALNAIGRADRALPHLEKAVSLMADPAVPYNNLGSSLMHLGRFDEAIKAYEKAIALRPRFAAAYRNLSMVKTFAKDDPQIAQMGTMLQQPMDPEDHAHLSFALAKACEDIGEDSHAFDLLAHGNRLKKGISGFSIEKDRELFAKIKSFFDEPPLALDARDGDEPRPIFIVGMPRSGTSLVEQILASHTKVYGAGELMALGRTVLPAINGTKEEFDRAALEHIRSRYLGALKELDQPKPIVVDKLPLNFRWIGFILSAMPEATVIHTKRNPVATGWSIFKQYFPAAGMNFAWDLADIAQYLELYDDLMAFWHERYPGRVLDLQYEELTENQEAETRRILDHCRLGWEDPCLDFHRTRRAVATASAVQIRKKMYKGSSEAWRKYEDRLEPLTRLAS